ncbi:MAG: type I 3-dehydroquinate dehydratase [Spirochaetaceae bacterium]|nr:type I 3-dehydroquinate dehydratase [Spirochaetaceae bacterium]
MICVSVGEKDYKNAIKVASLYDFAEVRLDLLETVDNKITEKIFSSHKNLIATYRKKDAPNANANADADADTDAKRLSVLKTAVESGAAYVDIDINESIEFISSARSLCVNNGRQFIISYHNYEETPSLDILDKVIVQALDKGADIVKIACTVKDPADVERLLSIPDYYNAIKIVIAGMGEHGGRARILSEAVGSFFTYASHDMKSCTAEGQLDYKTVLEEQRKIVSGW